jgi:hypothetical protein
MKVLRWSVRLFHDDLGAPEDVPSCFSGGKFMKMWYAYRSNLRYRLLRSGLGIILLIGLLSFGTGSYFWRMIDTRQRFATLPGRCSSKCRSLGLPKRISDCRTCLSRVSSRHNHERPRQTSRRHDSPRRGNSEDQTPVAR